MKKQQQATEKALTFLNWAEIWCPVSLTNWVFSAWLSGFTHFKNHLLLEHSVPLYSIVKLLFLIKFFSPFLSDFFSTPIILTPLRFAKALFINLKVKPSWDKRSSGVKEARKWCNRSQLLISPVYWHGYRHLRLSEKQLLYRENISI